jgi:hypothetical protein
MADNVAYTPGTGATIAADDVSGVLHQRVKLSIGADGSAADASASNPLPISQGFGTPKLTKETVGTSSAQIVSTAQTGRRLVKLYADPANTATIYYRFTSSVTTSNGMPLLPGQLAEEPLTDGGSATIYCISSSASQTLWVREYAP